MVHNRTPLDGVKGSLSLEDQLLVFRPEGGRSGTTSIPLRRIVRIRRARGTPVLEVGLEMENAPPVIGFYFVKPPSLIQPTENYRPFGRFLAKRRGIATLRSGNAARGMDVDLWAKALQEAQESGEGSEGTD
jgi:hypothetical protein